MVVLPDIFPELIVTPVIISIGLPTINPNVFLKLSVKSWLIMDDNVNVYVILTLPGKIWEFNVTLINTPPTISQTGVFFGIRFSLNPCVPPPQEILNGTPICFSLSVFNALGMTSSKFSMVWCNLPFI